MKTNKLIQDLLLGLALISLGILTRTIFHIAPNIEFVTASAFAAGYLFHNKRYSFFVPLAIMLVSDMLIGNTIIFLFTWTAFLATPILGYLSNKVGKNLNIISNAEIGGLVSTGIFFLWTNFGVVLTTSMYAKNIAGLSQSYINALPFLRNQLLGNILLVPLVLVGAKYLQSLISKIRVKEGTRANTKELIK